jgi:prepilin-type N-terminal cleavage/methylation domain-containing protein
MKMIHRGEKGFTLIELLVVIAILGVIAAVVALNVGNFFGRGTVQSANTELHQVQTAVIAAMADPGAPALTSPAEGESLWWAGGNDTSQCPYVVAYNGTDDIYYLASDYVFGPFRAAYLIDHQGRILEGSLNSTYADAVPIGSPWTGIKWDNVNKNWVKE